jgi:hypothetical protein
MWIGVAVTSAGAIATATFDNILIEQRQSGVVTEKVALRSLD